MPVASLIEKMLGAPALLIPTGQSSDNCHLANERLRRLNLIKGAHVHSSRIAVAVLCIALYCNALAPDSRQWSFQQLLVLQPSRCTAPHHTALQKLQCFRATSAAVASSTCATQPPLFPQPFLTTTDTPPPSHRHGHPQIKHAGKNVVRHLMEELIAASAAAAATAGSAVAAVSGVAGRRSSDGGGANGGGGWGLGLGLDRAGSRGSEGAGLGDALSPPPPAPAPSA